jgi:uncharacterized oligopeptide transporter (OPT) family protein
MGGNLPWSLVFIGVGVGVGIELLGLPVLPIAIGLYLPIHLSTPIMVGGFIRGILDRKKAKVAEDSKESHSIGEKIESGILYASGLIAGEGLIGILLAVFAVAGLNLNLGMNFGQMGALVLFALLTFTLIKNSLLKKA